MTRDSQATTVDATPTDQEVAMSRSTATGTVETGRGAVLGIARWSARHPWRAIAGWIAFVVLCLTAGSAAGTNLLSDAETGSGESGRADRVVESAGFPTAVTEKVLVQARQGALSGITGEAVVAELRDKYSSIDAVVDVGRPVVSEKDRSMLLPVTLDSGGETGEAAVEHATDEVGAMQAVTRQVAAEHPELRVEQVGEASLEASLGKQIDEDFQRAEMLSVPLTLAILVVAFGALFAAGVPVMLALTAVAAAIGLSALASHLTPTQEALNSVILLIGMAVGVDYSLFYVRRAREERAKGASKLDSVELAAATSGRAVLVSGVAVMIAMSGMFLSGNSLFISFAVGTMLVVAVAVLGSLTVLPAVLAKLGDGIDRPRVPFIHRWRKAHHHDARFWPAVMRVVLARPAVSLTVGVAALLALAAPAVTMRLHSSGPDDLPRSVAELRTYDRVIEAFPQEGGSHEVVIWSDHALDRAAVDAATARLEKAAVATGLFASTDENPEYAPNGEVARIELPTPYDVEDARSGQSLDELRQSLVPAAYGGFPGVSTAVTGETAGDADFAHQLAVRLPVVIGFVLLLTFFVLVLAFRSVVVAGTAIALNLLSVAAAYGLLVVVFQHSWAEGLLGFHSNGAIISWLPLFLFVVLFGLSMDYHVFVVSRIREAVRRGLPTKEAVAEGVTASAGVVTSAAVVMVGVFGIFATLSLLDLKQLGIGLAAAVLLDATIVRALLLPSVMALLGQWNWWLPRSWERLPHFEGASPPPAMEERVPVAT
jgi:RND superfamily putative drug exporter